MRRTSRFTTLWGIALLACGGLAGLHLGERLGAARPAAPPATAQAAVEGHGANAPPTSQQIENVLGISRTIAQVASQVGGSVVRIAVIKKGKKEEGNPFEGTPFERFFDERHRHRPPPRLFGLGSGVVIDSQGHILTNDHVVEGASSVKVTFLDGRTVPGKVVGTDPKSDLAVVKVDQTPVQPARFGDSNAVAVGEWVIAIGNPFGLDHTVTLGVLSAKNRSGFERGQYEDFLQTDASINPGNSGGPLVNLRGEVIGINTMIAGLGTGIGFAVPTSMARPIVEQLVKSGRVRRPYLGILMQDLTPELRKSIGDGVPEHGAIVAKVEPGSPAERAGVKAGDVITALDGKPVDGSQAVQRLVLGHTIGDKVELTLWRDGKTHKVSATTTELPEERGGARGGGGPAAPEGGAHRYGLSLQTLTPDLAERLGLDRSQKGAVVVGVRDGSPASDAGLKEGDLIVEVDRHAVASAEEAARWLAAKRSGGHLLRVRRGDAIVFVPLGG